MGNDHAKGGSGVTPAGIQSMDETLQKKFSKGIQFNSKFPSYPTRCKLVTYIIYSHVAL